MTTTSPTELEEPAVDPRKLRSSARKNSTRVGRKRDISSYLSVRIDQLTQERAKNDDDVAHMVLDKAVDELSMVLDYVRLLEAETPLHIKGTEED